MNTKALVVFSGGQDSTTCLFWALKEFDEVETLCFDYGQRHRIEEEAARTIAENAKVPFTLLNLDLLKQITHNSLTDQEMDVEENKPDNRPPNTLVEGRNMLFLTFAAIFAKGKDIPNLVTGVGQADYSGYPDCRDEFIRSLNQTLNLSMDYPFTIHTPLMWKSKQETRCIRFGSHSNRDLLQRYQRRRLRPLSGLSIETKWIGRVLSPLNPPKGDILNALVKTYA